MHVDTEVLTALTTATTAGNHLVLTGPRMDSRLYQRVNDVLEAVGGRWTKSLGAHVFPCDAAAAIAPVLATRQVVTLREKRQDAQYFPTPAPVVERLIAFADLAPGMDVLEPSAGTGAIVTAAAAQGAVVDCVERDPGYAAALTDVGARTVTCADFLTVPVEPRYDRVIMNPPFTRQSDITHVQHALGFLRPDGLLVAVMSNAVTYQRQGAAFRALVESRGGRCEALPAGAFATSGTGARTVIVTIPATRPADPVPVCWDDQTADHDDQPADLPDPAVLAREIADDLRRASAAFDRVARSLARPASPAVAKAAVILGQLALDVGQPT